MPLFWWQICLHFAAISVVFLFVSFSFSLTPSLVHRIGRTGRCGKTGVATTFVNTSCSETILLDIKHVLIEAKQKVPPFLKALDMANVYVDELMEKTGVIGCSYCGGLGHRINECPKATELKMRQMKSMGRGEFGGLAGGYWSFLVLLVCIMNKSVAQNCL